MKTSRASTQSRRVLIIILLLTFVLSSTITQPLIVRAQSSIQPIPPPEKPASLINTGIPVKSDYLLKEPNPVLPKIAAATGILNGGFENGRDGSWTEYSLLGWPLII